jgi:hypothetical protein
MKILKETQRKTREQSCTERKQKDIAIKEKRQYMQVKQVKLRGKREK